MKKLLLISMSALLLAACGEETTEGEDAPAPTENEQTEETSEDSGEDSTEDIAEAEETSDTGTRSHPVPVGETKTQEMEFYGDDSERYEGIYSLTLSNPVRGEEVYNYLMEANQFNEEAPEGMEWVMIDVEYVLDKASTEDEPVYVMPSFTVIDSSGSEVSQSEVYATLAGDDEFGYVEVYSGGNASGKHVFYAPIDDDILLKYDDYNSSPIFFNLDETNINADTVFQNITMEYSKG